MSDSDGLLDRLRIAKKVFLLEPPYKRKYPPLGLAKIATYVKTHGGSVIFGRRYTPGLNEDLVCVTSLFTYEAPTVVKAVRVIRAWNRHVPIIVGGVMASILPDYIHKKLPYVTLFRGYSKELDLCPPDYTINWRVISKWQPYSFVFTTRGCPNRCPYCAVWRIESESWINPKWKDHIHPDKPNVMISDNNFSAQSFDHIRDVCDFLIDQKKRVVFDNGFDCNHVTSELAEIVGKIKFLRHGMRLAFDRIKDDGAFQTAIETLREKGIPKSAFQAYVLFNFTDTPREAIYRATECIKHGVRPYPQQYVPLTATSRFPTYIGKHWTPNLVSAFRHFYLMVGYHHKYQFDEWIKSEKAIDRFKLGEDDYAALEN